MSQPNDSKKSAIPLEQDNTMTTPPSPAVRNHRIALRLAPESVSALQWIPHQGIKNTIRQPEMSERESMPLLYAAVDRAGVALASTPYLTTQQVRPVVI